MSKKKPQRKVAVVCLEKKLVIKRDLWMPREVKPANEVSKYVSLTWTDLELFSSCLNLKRRTGLMRNLSLLPWVSCQRSFLSCFLSCFSSCFLRLCCLWWTTHREYRDEKKKYHFGVKSCKNTKQEYETRRREFQVFYYYFVPETSSSLSSLFSWCWAFKFKLKRCFSFFLSPKKMLLAKSLPGWLLAKLSHQWFLLRSPVTKDRLSNLLSTSYIIHSDLKESFSLL